MCDEPWVSWDFLPTAVEPAGASLPDSFRPDGFRPVSMLNGPSAPKREYFYWELHEGGFIQAIRFGNRRAVRGGPYAPLELYNANTDVGEAHDLAAEETDLVAKAEALMKAARVDDPNWPMRKRAPRKSIPAQSNSKRKKGRSDTP